MPNGRIHLILWKQYRTLAYALAILVSFVGYWLGSTTKINSFYPLGFFFLIGYFLGYYIDPDLDQESTTSAKWRMMRDFKLLGAFISGWFLPYGFLFKHRSVPSHTPGISSFIRLVWLLLFPLFPLIVYFILPTVEAVHLAILFFGVWLGLTLSDSVHTFADWGIIKTRRK